MLPSIPAVKSKFMFSDFLELSVMLVAQSKGPVWPLSVKYGSKIALSALEASVYFLFRSDKFHNLTIQSSETVANASTPGTN